MPMRKVENLADEITSEPVNKKKKSLIMIRYEKYYRGYQLYRIPANNHRGYKVEQIYTDQYHVPAMSCKNFCVLKGLYFCLFVLSLVVMLFAFQCISSYVPTFISIVFEALSLWMYGFVFFTLIEYIFDKYRRTHAEYEISRKLQNRALYMSVVLTLHCCYVLIYYFGQMGIKTVIPVILILISECFILLIRKIEAGIKYELIDNQVEIPVGAVRID